MHKTHKLVLLSSILFIFSIASAFGQQNRIDSLELLVNDPTLPDTTKILTMVQLGAAYSTTGINRDLALSYRKKAATLARKQKDSKYGAIAYAKLAHQFTVLDSVVQAYESVDSCLYFLNRTKDREVRTESLLSLSHTKYTLSDNDGVLEMLLEAYELNKEDKSGVILARIYHLLAVYYFSFDLSKAKEYAQLCLKEAEVSDNLDQMCTAWTIFGAMLLEESKNSDTALSDSAMYACKQAIYIYEQNPDKVQYSNYMVALSNLGTLFYRMKTEDTDAFIYPDSVLYYANKVREIAFEKGDADFIDIVTLIADIQYAQNNIAQAEQTFREALNILESKNGFYRHKEFINGYASSFYKRRNRYEEALAHKEKQIEYQELINKQTYSRESMITEAKYQVQKKESELKLSQQRTKQQKQLFIGSIIGSILLIFLLLTFYRSRLRSTKQKAILMEKENEEIRLNALVKEKELQKSELEKELEKEKAERQALEINRLQTELVAGISQLDQKNEMIERIKEKIDDKDIKDLLLSDKLAEKSYEDFQELLQKIHPLFYEKLQEKAEQKLTTLDLRYCTYILMNFTSKEIANIMHVDPNTVRTNKYRLKLKLNLSKDQDITTYLQELKKSLTI